MTQRLMEAGRRLEGKLEPRQAWTNSARPGRLGVAAPPHRTLARSPSSFSWRPEPEVVAQRHLDVDLGSRVNTISGSIPAASTAPRFARRARAARVSRTTESRGSSRAPQLRSGETKRFTIQPCSLLRARRCSASPWSSGSSLGGKVGAWLIRPPSACWGRRGLRHRAERKSDVQAGRRFGQSKRGRSGPMKILRFAEPGADRRLRRRILVAASPTAGKVVAEPGIANWGTLADPESWVLRELLLGSVGRHRSTRAMGCRRPRPATTRSLCTGTARAGLPLRRRIRGPSPRTGTSSERQLAQRRRRDFGANDVWAVGSEFYSANGSSSTGKKIKVTGTGKLLRH